VAYDEALANQVRAMLGATRSVQEKRMFGGLVFMVRGKMCVSVGEKRIMCRIDPAIHDAALRRKGCRTVIMRGHPYRGYVYIDTRIVRGNRLDYWVRLALDCNGR
jgi:TfoX/Sxy family transcriptional regulator of competence genes